MAVEGLHGKDPTSQFPLPYPSPNSASAAPPVRRGQTQVLLFQSPPFYLSQTQPSAAPPPVRHSATPAPSTFKFKPPALHRVRHAAQIRRFANRRMSTSGGGHTFDVKELLGIKTRCKEKLEQHEQILSEAQEEDKNHTRKLKSELENCFQEIDYLQDQLNLRNEEIDSLNESVCSLSLKLANLESMEEEVTRLREELETSNTERLYLLQQLENKELEIEGSALCIERLEESIASIGLEHQFEIESMKLDLIAIQQSYFEAKKSQDETAQDSALMNELIHDLELRVHDAEKVIESVEKENKNLREQLQASELNAKTFSEKVEELFRGWLANNDDSSSSKEDDGASSCCGEILGPLLMKLAAIGPSDIGSTDKMREMAGQIENYESLVKWLKEELRTEKLKAKEETEDLAQEMAELRYQVTGLLEIEHKRRACVEQLSLQRIAELEAQVEKERMNSFTEEDPSKSITIFRHVSEA